MLTQSDILLLMPDGLDLILPYFERPRAQFQSESEGRRISTINN